MKRIFLLSLTAATVLLLAQCSPKTASNTTAVKPAPATGTEQPAPDPAAMAQGQVIYQGNCGRCHKLYAPEAYTAKQWNRILPEMYRKAKLDEAKAALVDAYVLPKAKKG